MNTAIHESLLICRRRDANEPRRPTTFVALMHMPETDAEVARWLRSVHDGWRHVFHRTFEWPAAKVAEGDWTPCQYLDGTLAELAKVIDELDATTPLGDLALVEPGGRRLRDAFVNPLGHQPKPEYQVVWTHDTSDRQTMRSFSDFATEPKPAKREYATNVLAPKASRMLVACKINPLAIRVAAIHLPQAMLGQPFIPVTPLPHVSAPAATLEAWCAYLNSTPAILSFMNRRQKKLTYADYSLDQLRSMPVPDPSKRDLAPLQAAFHKLRESALMPWPQMDRCAVRAELDEATAAVLGIDAAEVADWRQRIVREPTVCNKAPYARIRDPFVVSLLSGPSLEGVDLTRDRSPMRDVEL